MIMALTIQQLAEKVNAIDQKAFIQRGDVEDVLDFYVLVEQKGNPFHHLSTVDHGKAILRKYGEQVFSATGSTATMTLVADTFVSSFKYNSTMMKVLVRASIEDAWDGIGDFRA